MLKTRLNALILTSACLLSFTWAPPAQAGFGSFIDWIIETQPVRTQLDEGRVGALEVEQVGCVEEAAERSGDLNPQCEALPSEDDGIFGVFLALFD